MKKLMSTVMFLAATATAAANAQGVVVRGVGTFSCGHYIELRAANNTIQDAVAASWIWGYMAGFNNGIQVPHDSSRFAGSAKHAGLCRQVLPGEPAGHRPVGR